MTQIEASVSHKCKSPIRQMKDRAYINIRRLKTLIYFVESRTACGKFGI